MYAAAEPELHGDPFFTMPRERDQALRLTTLEIDPDPVAQEELYT